MNDAIKLRICTINGPYSQVEINQLRDDSFEVVYRVKNKPKEKQVFKTYAEALESATSYFQKEP